MTEPATYGFLPGADASTLKPVVQKPIIQAVREEKAEKEATQQRKDQTTLSDAIGAVQVKGGIGFIDRLVQSMDYAPTPGYRIPADARKRWEAEGIRPEQWELFGRAVSDDHLRYLEGLARQNQMADEDLAQYGLVGNMALSLTDPVATGIDLLSGGLGYAEKAGRLANAVRAGVQAASVNATMDAAAAAYDPEVTLQDGLKDAALGFVMAGALGARKGALHTGPDDVEKVKRIAGLSQEADKENMGAAKVSGLAPDPTPGLSPLRPESDVEQALVDRAYANADVRPALAPVRFDLAAKGGTAAAPEVREITRAYFRDGVGYTDRDRAVEESAPEYAKRHLADMETQWRAGVGQAWEKYKAANGGWRGNSVLREQFNEEVGRAVRGATDVSEEAKAAAASVSQVMSQALNLAKENGLEGFDQVSANGNYLPRYWSNKGFRKLFDEYGLDENDVVEQLIKPAMRKVWDMGDPEDAAKLAEIEDAYKGSSNVARQAREKVDDLQKEVNYYRNRLEDHEKALADLGENAPVRRRNAAERRVRETRRKMERSIDRHEKAKANLTERLKSDAEASSARKAAREVADHATSDREELLSAVAKSLLKRAQANFEKDPMALLVRPLDSASVDEIRTMLREAGVTDARATELLSRLEKKADDGAKLARAKRRIDLDENYETTMTAKDGSRVKVRMSDLYDNNVDSVMTRYLREITGWSALANKLGVRNRAELDRVHNRVLQAAQKAGDNAEKVKRLLEIGERSTFGRSTERDPNSGASRWGRFVRNWNFARTMNQVGFSQFAELGTAIAHTGIRGFLMSAPEIRGFIKRGADGQLTSKEARVIEKLFGAPGTDALRNPPFLRLDPDDGGMAPTLFGDSSNQRLRRVGNSIENGLNWATHATSWLSGMAPLNVFLQRLSSRAFLLRMMDMAKKGPSKAEVHRLRSWGLSEADQAKVFDVLRKAKNIEDINPDSLDFQTREKMSGFLYRASRQIILEGDAADSVMMMHNPVGRVILQFRSFMFYSYTRHFLNSLHHLDDWRSYAMMVLSTASAGMGWAAREYLNTAGDPEKRKKNLTYDNFAKNAVAQSSWSNFIPTISDSIFKDAMGLTEANAKDRLGFNPLFTNNRSTGLQNGVMGIPAVDLATKVYGSTRAIGSLMWDDEHVTQKQVQDFYKTLWFQNMTGVRNIADMVIKDNLPEHRDGSSN